LENIEYVGNVEQCLESLLYDISSL